MSAAMKLEVRLYDFAEILRFLFPLVRLARQKSDRKIIPIDRYLMVQIY
jgi:hypothetical protein